MWEKMNTETEKGYFGLGVVLCPWDPPEKLHSSLYVVRREGSVPEQSAKKLDKPEAASGILGGNSGK